MKRVFKKVEIVFDVLYLTCGAMIGIQYLVGTSSLQQLAGVMAGILILGDSFHLVPRIISIATKQEKSMEKALGLGKLITSLTMTVFYLILWHLAVLLSHQTTTSSLTILIYALALIRIVLCLLPQNQWLHRTPPVRWGIWRNIPFVLMGMLVAWNYATNVFVPELSWMPWAIFLSFAFYLPVVLWANQKPKIGMLMLPKSCVYLWILAMFATIH